MHARPRLGAYLWIMFKEGMKQTQTKAMCFVGFAFGSHTFVTVGDHQMLPVRTVHPLSKLQWDGMTTTGDARLEISRLHTRHVIKKLLVVLRALLRRTHARTRPPTYGRRTCRHGDIGVVQTYKLLKTSRYQKIAHCHFEPKAGISSLKQPSAIRSSEQASRKKFGDSKVHGGNALPPHGKYKHHLLCNLQWCVTVPGPNSKLTVGTRPIPKGHILPLPSMLTRHIRWP